jgi:flagellar motility protein MotE (MotC chaperone)
MFDRLKFFPVTIAILIAFFGMKALDVWTGVDVQFGAIGEAVASEAKSTHEPKPTHEEPAVATKSHGSASQSATGHEEIIPSSNGEYLSASDVDIMNSLEDRDAKYETWEQELKLRENMLSIAEKKIEAKIAELRSLEGKLKQVVGEQSAKEEEDLLRLVKVYENMKAKAAAPILERLDSSTRLSIAGRMKEVKLAAILPYMTKEAAQELTTQMMHRSDFPTELSPDTGNPEL